MANKPLKFMDMKTKKSFETEKYTIEMQYGRRVAKTIAPSGAKAQTFVKNEEA